MVRPPRTAVPREQGRRGAEGWEAWAAWAVRSCKGRGRVWHVSAAERHKIEGEVSAARLVQSQGMHKSHEDLDEALPIHGHLLMCHTYL